jgi:hypothetical protein
MYSLVYDSTQITIFEQCCNLYLCSESAVMHVHRLPKLSAQGTKTHLVA